MKIDVRKLRAFHKASVAERSLKLEGRPAHVIAEDCARVLAAMDAFVETHKAEIENGGYGSFDRFAEVYALGLERFEDVLAQSFALDEPDAGGLFGEATRLVATALPFLDDPRSYALRALTGAPPFEPPGPLARRLLDLRATLADVERWKQREFQASWMRWGRYVWTLDHQAAWICTNLGDAVAAEEIAFTPFADRLPRLRAARAAKNALKGDSMASP